MQQDFLRDRDVAAALGISRQHVWRLVREGVLPRPLKIGARSSRFERDAVMLAIRKASAHHSEANA